MNNDKAFLALVLVLALRACDVTLKSTSASDGESAS